MNERVKPEQISKYLDGNNCFINENEIEQMLISRRKPDTGKIKDILQKSLQIETLTPEETAYLMDVNDRDLLEEMKQTAAKVKKKVYDNRIVTFAPLYLGNLCVNDCVYCGFRRSNKSASRRKLLLQEVKSETEVLAGQIGHKRLIVVYGEHPETDVDYIASTIQTIYDVKVKTRNGSGQIRRANVNAAPLSIEELELLKDVGIGTFQVFQETYHRPTYEKVHPGGLGVLFGLYDWKFEVMGLLYHAIELEKKFGIGPHTISFPRLEPASNTPFAENPGFTVDDEDFKRLVTVLRLAVPYTGMILTARENPAVRRDILPIGCTQIDASSCIGIGGYSEMLNEQQLNKQQFQLGDTRSLDAVIRELAESGYITSFCTAGYRCGRTGKRIMKLLRTGTEGKYCKLNAVLTFREWLDDFAGPETLAAGQKILEKEIQEIRQKMPDIYPDLLKFLEKTEAGQRDLYF